MQAFLQQMIIGLVNGMVFALIALGYTMVYGILELINFAHGDLFALSAFFALTVLSVMPLAALGPVGTLSAILLVIVLTAGFGAGTNWAMDRWVFRPIRGGHKLAPMVTAIGMSLILQNVALLWGGLPLPVFGMGHSAAAPKAFFELVPHTNLLPESWGVVFGARDAMVVGVSLIALAVVWFVVHRTAFGRAMRAIAQDPLAAKLMGIDTQRIIGATFAMGGALAGVASVIYGLYIGTIHYQMGYQNGLYAFVAAVLGGIGSIGGAVAGALVLGFVRALSDQYVGVRWQPAILFGLLIVVMALAPTGLFGRGRREKV
jgi:branched-chain amino acid transport system permease protein